jgi:hypothetical protein
MYFVQGGWQVSASSNPMTNNELKLEGVANLVVGRPAAEETTADSPALEPRSWKSWVRTGQSEQSLTPLICTSSSNCAQWPV